MDELGRGGRAESADASGQKRTGGLWIGMRDKLAALIISGSILPPLSPLLSLSLSRAHTLSDSHTLAHRLDAISLG